MQCHANKKTLFSFYLSVHTDDQKRKNNYIRIQKGERDDYSIYLQCTVGIKKKKTKKRSIEIVTNL